MAVITLDDAKSVLGITDTSKDALLQSYVDGVTPVVEYLSSDIDQTDYTETYDGGRVQIMLLHYPVISVSSVIESYGSNYVRTLTADDIFSGAAVDAYAYTLDDADTGALTRRAAGVAVNFAPGRRNIQVVYTAGRAVVPGNLRLAALEMVRFWWETAQQGNRPAFGDAPEETFGAMPSDVRERVHEILAGDIRLPGIG